MLRNTTVKIVLTVALPLVVVAAVSAGPAFAQSPRGTIRGIVLDQTGGRLSAVQIRAIREETNISRETVSDAVGRFALAELDPGRYSIEARRTGFTIYRHRLQLAVGEEIWLEPELVVTATAAVTTGAPETRVPFPDRHSPAIATLIDREHVARLPLDGRNFLELALLAPGTAPAPQGSASSVRGDFALAVNGAREDFANYLLDGVSNVDPKLGTPAVRPPVDGIDEFKVSTSTYDAAFGRNGGAQVNILTRSGGNAFSGAAYEFVRSGALDSRNFFAPAGEPDPEYSRHQFGGAIGGPLVRDKTFFFADYERTRLREGLTRVTNVPTAAERVGDFSQSLLPPVTLPGLPFPTSRIPPPFLNPIGLAIANLYPLPNRSTPLANFVSSPTLADDGHQFDGKVEHTFAAGMRVTGRYSLADRTLVEPFAGAGFSAVPGFGNLVDRRGQNLAVGLTTARAAWVNDLRFGYTRVSIGVAPENASIDNATVGLPAVSPNARDAGLSFITIAGFSPLGHEYTNPQASTSDTFQIADTLTIARGQHLFKVGGEWQAVRQSAFRDVQARGFITFVQQGYTGNALADALLGLPVVTGAARLDNPQNLRTGGVSLFGNDDWRVGRKLTLSAGVRYDYMSPPVDADDRATLYDTASGTLVAVGTNGMPRGGYEPDRNNVAPRIGAAWTLDEQQAWVARGGYGIYYNQGALASSEGLYFNPPYFNLSLYFPVSGRPPITLYDPFPSSFPIPVPQSATAIQRDLRTPWMEHWSANLQRQIGRSSAIEVGYVGSRGHDLISARDVNQAAARPVTPNLRPNPSFADITLIESRASSRYHALQIKYQQRVEIGLSAFATYTYGRSTDDASGFFASAGDPNFPQNSHDPAAERSRSSFDVRHRITFALAYTLPLAGNVWLDDWQLQAVGAMNSGRPFTVALHPDIDISNTGRSNLGFGNNDRPNVTGSGALGSGERSHEQWFDTAAFSMPAFGTFGNTGRNSLNGPGYGSVSLAVVKAIQAGPAELQLRIETFNVFNRVNFDLPDAFLGSPTFGRILSAGAPRRVQFGVRASF
jgi:hypothetical protein